MRQDKLKEKNHESFQKCDKCGIEHQICGDTLQGLVHP